MLTPRIKVCHLSSGHEGHESRIFQRQCTSLAQKYDVSLIIPNDRDEVVNGVKIVRFKKYGSTFARFFFAPLRMYFAARKIKASVYHFHDPELIATGVLLKLTTKARVVYDAHEDVPGAILSRHYPSAAIRRVISVIFASYQKQAVKLFDAVVCATDKIQSTFGTARSSVVIYNYPIIDRFLSENVQKDGTVVFFGTMSLERGIFQICEAVKILNSVYHKPLKLRLIGKISPADVEHEVLQKYGPYIEYMEWMNIDKAYELVQKSSIGLVTYLPAPNHDHCMPNKMFEYMTFGMPIVCSSFEIMKEIVEKNGCGICVNPESAEEIAQALDYLTSHPQVMDEMGEKGKKVVVENYNWRPMEDRLFALYAGLDLKPS